MSTSDLHIRRGGPADTADIVRFVLTSMGPSASVPRTEDYWRWKHWDNPFGVSPVLIAESDGQMVGLRAFMRWTWTNASGAYQAVRAVDTATHPDFRGRGIFRTLTLQLVEEMREEGVHFVFNTPNQYSRPGYLKMGWEAVGALTVLVRPVRPLRLARYALPVPPPDADEDAEALTGGRPVADLFEERGLESLLRARRPHPTALATPRSLEYLRWRYEQLPGLSYCALWDLDTDGGAAIIYRMRRRRWLREASLSEVFVSPGAEARLRRLVGKLAKSSGADYIASVAPPGSDERRILFPAGFVPVPRLGPILTVNPLNDAPTLPALTETKNWRFSVGDLELF